MEIRYKQDINHNYMILNKSENAKASLAERMLLHNNIPGLLKLSVQHLNGKAYYFYDIRSRQSLEVLFEGRNMSGSELKNLLSGLVKVSDKMSDYLLKSTDILVNPQCIFWNLETGEPVFCCYPETGEAYAKAYLELAQFIIDTVDKEDEDAVKMAYDYFNQVCDGIYSPDNIVNKIMTVEEAAIPNDAVYEEALPRESLWENDGFDDEISGDDEADLLRDDEKPADKKKIIYIGAGLILTVGILFAALFLNPSLLKMFGMNKSKLISMAGIAVILVASIVLLLIYTKKHGGKASENNSEDFYFPVSEKGVEAVGDKIEQEEYASVVERMSAADSSGETVLLSDYMPTGTLAGRKIRTELARLSGIINGREENFEINKSPFTIGKMAGKADAVIADRRVSRIHATIRQDGGRYFLSDLNSTNGTCLNDRRLEQDEAAALEDGDIIKFANVMLKFSL